MINYHKILIFTLIISFLISSCSSVQKALDPQRKNNSEEFLVEKKSPLSMPPNFKELPTPKIGKLENEKQNNDIEDLFKNKTENIENSNKNIGSNLEKTILDKIKRD